MNFNKHFGLEGKHAFLSASKYHWVNYDKDKLVKTYSTHMDVMRGTELHELAERLIRLGVQLPDNGQTLSMHVNDAIGYSMEPEQILYYSPNCFGTADAISFKNNLLRIHDLKTGVSKASMLQPEIYAALFCLEYDVSPKEIEIELRIYQLGEKLIDRPDPDDIFHIMDKIITFDRIIDDIRSEGFGL